MIKARNQQPLSARRYLPKARTPSSCTRGRRINRTAYQVKASLVTPSPVFLRCSLQGSPVGENSNPLWYFVESRRAGSRAKGWVSDHWLNTGTSQSVTPMCRGDIANPSVGSGGPNQ